MSAFGFTPKTYKKGPSRLLKLLKTLSLDETIPFVLKPLNSHAYAQKQVNLISPILLLSTFLGTPALNSNHLNFTTGHIGIKAPFMKRSPTKY